ncbi:hypothetical protein KIW84_054778 [Lathyrus oleraceus]|uniref:GRF-type domain-containing protein n=1 Tax=Pisum sativum TaxID=3888 RepID=A0A9D4WV64_PEA|nr:hypothetical protein KIW84_054778 [Pisum sativum]
MGGSKASSTSEVGNGLPRCGCNETMKLLVSKSIENPGRKFWKCRNNMNGCGLFLWDDLVSEFAVKETNQSGCRQCEVNKAYLIEFAKEIVEEIDCRVGKLNKLEKLKKKIAMEKRKNLWLMFEYIYCWARSWCPSLLKHSLSFKFVTTPSLHFYSMPDYMKCWSNRWPALGLELIGMMILVMLQVWLLRGLGWLADSYRKHGVCMIVGQIIWYATSVTWSCVCSDIGEALFGISCSMNY